jgi:hypothetical protein
MFPRPKAREKVRTWVKSQWKFTSAPGQFSAAINTQQQAATEAFSAGSRQAQTLLQLLG